MRFSTPSWLTRLAGLALCAAAFTATPALAVEYYSGAEQSGNNVYMYSVSTLDYYDCAYTAYCDAFVEGQEYVNGSLVNYTNGLTGYHVEADLSDTAVVGNTYTIAGFHYFFNSNTSSWDNFGYDTAAVTVYPPTPTPQISGISPDIGVVGIPGYIAIYGYNLSGTGWWGDVTVIMDGASLPMTYFSDGQINVSYPGLALGTHWLYVWTSGGPSNYMSFTVSAGDPTPTVSSFSPAVWQYNQNNQMSIAGSGFGTSPSVYVSYPDGASEWASVTNAADTLIYATAYHHSTLSGSIAVTVYSNGYWGSGFIPMYPGQPNYTALPGAASVPAVVPGGTVGQYYSVSFGATGSNWAVVGTPLPDGLSVAGNGVVSGIPRATGFGTRTVNFQMSDGLGVHSGSLTFGIQAGALKVVRTSRPVSNIRDTAYANGIGVTYSYTLCDANGYGCYDPFAISSCAGSSGISMAVSATHTAFAITYTVPPGLPGGNSVVQCDWFGIWFSIDPIDAIQVLPPPPTLDNISTPSGIWNSGLSIPFTISGTWLAPGGVFTVSDSSVSIQSYVVTGGQQANITGMLLISDTAPAVSYVFTYVASNGLATLTAPLTPRQCLSLPHVTIGNRPMTLNETIPYGNAPYHATLAASGIPSAANGTYHWSTNNPGMIQFSDPAASTVTVTVSRSGKATITVSYGTPCGNGTDSLTFVLTDDVTVVGSIDADALSPPSAASPLSGVLNNAISCGIEVSAWTLAGYTGVTPIGFQVTTADDRAYANWFLLHESANTPVPPSIMVNADAFSANASNYRAYNRFAAYWEMTGGGIQSGSVQYLHQNALLGMTPEPCTGTQLFTVASETSILNNTRKYNTGSAFQLAQGRVGQEGQAANAYLNHPNLAGSGTYFLATPWIWSAITFAADGSLLPFGQGSPQNNLQIFPTYRVYRNAGLVQTLTQSPASSFISLDSTSSYSVPF